MKIAIDAMGGDYAPQVVIEGAKLALKEYERIETLFLVGNESKLKPIIDSVRLPLEKIEIVHTDEIVEMHESGAKMLRKKKNSSISLATDLVKKGEAQAVIGAGNTGAAVANASVKLRTLEGVGRAGIASPLPNEFGKCILLDAGANPDPKPEHLVEYAFMGSMYSNMVQDESGKKPKVGVLSNGEEEEKGTELTKAVHTQLKQMSADGVSLPFEYLGYVEGRDLYLSDLQVCVTDGFSGNLVLKASEGVAKGMSLWMKQEFKKSPLRMLGALCSKGVFAAIKDRTSHEKAGGSLLLGVNGLCVIGHGSSTAFAIKNAIRLAVESLQSEINPAIIESMKPYLEWKFKQGEGLSQ